MAGLINGHWSNSNHVPSTNCSSFNSWVTLNGEQGPTGLSGFNAESGRYVLYLAKGCPNCHRVAIAKSILNMQMYFDVVWVNDIKRENGWEIRLGADPLFGATTLQGVMVAAEGAITARCTVPLLADKVNGRLVSNQSDDIVRMMNDIALRSGDIQYDLWPKLIANKIDTFNRGFRSSVASGVYDILFARSKNAKKKTNEIALGFLSRMDLGLEENTFLFGDNITASDVWAFPTLLRMNTVYSELFGLRCKLSDFRNLSRFIKALWRHEGFHEASNLDRIENHYFKSIIHGPDGPVEPGRGMSPPLHDRLILGE